MSAEPVTITVTMAANFAEHLGITPGHYIAMGYSYKRADGGFVLTNLRREAES